MALSGDSAIVSTDQMVRRLIASVPAFPAPRVTKLFTPHVEITIPVGDEGYVVSIRMSVDAYRSLGGTSELWSPQYGNDPDREGDG